ncbi:MULTISPECIES: beta-xylosidase family glycoside hydrolase [Streptomyces]|uniref:beta-xylosidase family glycoside hydrolase n=1 Tax=Streptomyces TaxID=1883 RepID=UPI0027E54CDB|nr:hypothetical protein [Streptomyces sp. GbtcB7]
MTRRIPTASTGRCWDPSGPTAPAPAPDWLSLTDRASHLRLRGGRSPQSLIAPSLVARRVTANTPRKRRATGSAPSGSPARSSGSGPGT